MHWMCAPGWQPWSRPGTRPPLTCMRSSSPVSACCQVSECMYCSVLMMRISRSSSGMMAPVRQPCRSMRSWGRAEARLSTSQGAPPWPRGPGLPPHRQVTVEVVSEVEHTRASPFCQTQEVKQVSLGTGGDTAEPSVPQGFPCCQKHAWSPPLLPNLRDREAFRPDAGLPFPVACCLLWALALATSASHSDGGSPAAGRSPVGLAWCPCASRVSSPKPSTHPTRGTESTLWEKHCSIDPRALKFWPPWPEP